MSRADYLGSETQAVDGVLRLSEPGQQGVIVLLHGEGEVLEEH